MIRQRLQSEPQFRSMYIKQVAKEMQLEQALESKLSKEGKNRQAKVRGGGRQSDGVYKEIIFSDPAATETSHAAGDENCNWQEMRFVQL